MRKLRRRNSQHRDIRTPFANTRSSVILAWLNAKGYSGSFNDALMAYFKDQSGIAVASLDDHVSQALTAAGFVGPTLQDQLAGFFCSQTGIAYYPDAERAFFSDPSYDFGGILGRMSALGNLTFLKDYSDDQTTANADFAIGSTTATVSATRSASAPATYINSAGVMQTVTTSNTPRFTNGFFGTDGYTQRKGIIVEGTSSNFVTQSSDMSHADWTKTAADGTHKRNSYEVSMGTLLEGFEASSDWTASGGTAAVSDDSTNFRQGAQSVKLTTDATVASVAIKTVSLDLSSVDNFLLWVYVADVTKVTDVSVVFSSQADLSKKYTITFDADDFKNNGWCPLIWKKAQMTNTGTDSFSNTMIRLQLTCTPTGGGTELSFDDLRHSYNTGGKAAVIWVFDDNYISHYNDVAPIFEANGQRIVCAIVGNLIDVGGRMSVAQMTELYNNGHDMVNHSYSHPDLTTQNDAQLTTQIVDTKATLDGYGYTRSSKFFVYPSSSSNETVIAKVKLDHVMARTGYATNAKKNGIPHTVLGDNDREFRIESYSMGTSGTATVQGWIDNAIASRSLIIIYQHDATVGNGVLSRLQSLSDYCKTKQDEGVLDVLTFSEYYDQFVTNTTAPDGTTVNVVSASADNATVLQPVTYASSISTYSVFLKASRTTGSIQITLDGGSTWTTVTLPTDEWGRFQVTNTLANPSVGVRLTNINDQVFMWGSQLEKVAFATSYIPTTTASLTRGVEKLSYVLTNNRTADTETVFVKFTPFWNGADAGSYRLTSTLTKERIIFLDAATDVLAFRPNSNDSGTASISSSIVPVRYSPYVVAGVAYGTGADVNQEIYVAGASEGTNTTDYLSPAWGGTFYMGCRQADGLELFGILHAVAFYSNALDSTAISLANAILED